MLFHHSTRRFIISLSRTRALALSLALSLALTHSLSLAIDSFLHFEIFLDISWMEIAVINPRPCIVYRDSFKRHMSTNIQ